MQIHSHTLAYSLDSCRQQVDENVNMARIFKSAKIEATKYKSREFVDDVTFVAMKNCSASELVGLRW